MIPIDEYEVEKEGECPVCHTRFDDVYLHLAIGECLPICSGFDQWTMGMWRISFSYHMKQYPVRTCWCTVKSNIKYAFKNGDDVATHMLAKGGLVQHYLECLMGVENE